MLAQRVIRQITKDITTKFKDGGLTPTQLSDLMTSALGGTDAQGTWTWRMAYDLVQAAAVSAAEVDPGNPARTLDHLSALMDRLPTETRRSERQVQLQQFSTPLDLAWLAVCAARLTPSDVILEPSAGTGTLARLAGQSGARLILNELDDQRASLLQTVTGTTVNRHDAEFIADLLEAQPQPSVVIMNPPFASSVTRSDPTLAARHVFSALKALRPGGRLVAIVPPSVSAEKAGRLWHRICAMATPVLRLHLPRRAFRKMGVSVSTDLLVLDKTGAGQGGETPPQPCSDLAMALKLILARCPARPQMGGTEPTPVTRKVIAPKESMVQRTSRILLPGKNAHSAATTEPLAFTVFDAPRANPPVSDVYASYAPQRISIEGAQPHPSPLVESLAMGSVHPPAPADLPLALPKRLITEGLLSDAQLETILMAETAFNTDLPGKFTRDDAGALERRDDADGAKHYRQGYFLGDGTGCGKGRQVAGTILAGWLAGVG
ncbi:strawberry notch-like NTP hydrolase domain-containing protein [Ruegeria sp. HKCCD8929]|uniref:strawberry notch-like NTP hydrolase domain-containing protein n=1 Tax=Ruegeria sp. HKCCD8929 TaxID=2683006 RepID=UPI001488EECD|nr:strawberry notch family protein [Ruegeria sp. HKCCD8929]